GFTTGVAQTMGEVTLTLNYRIDLPRRRTSWCGPSTATMSPTRTSSRRAPSSAIARTSTPSAWGRSSTSKSGAQGVPRRRDDATRSAPGRGAGLRGRRGARGRAASALGGQGPERGGASHENREGRDRRGSRGARRLLRRPGEGRGEEGFRARGDGGQVRQRHGEDRLADALP